MAHPRPAPRRGDHGRQPALGDRRGLRRPGRRPPSRRREGARAHRLVRRPRDPRGHAVGAVAREPRPARGGGRRRSPRSRPTRSPRWPRAGARRGCRSTCGSSAGATSCPRGSPRSSSDRPPCRATTARWRSRSRSPTPAATSCSRRSGRPSATPSTPGTPPDGLADALTAEALAAHLYTQGSSRPGPDHPDVRRGPAVGLPALAERLRRVPLRRGLLAGIPRDRLPARDPDLPAARPPLRPLAPSDPRGRSRGGPRQNRTPVLYWQRPSPVPAPPQVIHRRARMSRPSGPATPPIHTVSTVGPTCPRLPRACPRQGRSSTATSCSGGSVRADHYMLCFRLDSRFREAYSESVGHHRSRAGTAARIASFATRRTAGSPPERHGHGGTVAVTSPDPTSTAPVDPSVGPAEGRHRIGTRTTGPPPMRPAARRPSNRRPGRRVRAEPPHATSGGERTMARAAVQGDHGVQVMAQTRRDGKTARDKRRDARHFGPYGVSFNGQNPDGSRRPRA